MNPNQKPFDLQLAIAGHNLCTSDNRPAKFIAYVPDVISTHQVVAQVGDEVYTFDKEGILRGSTKSSWDLFLAPLGFCEGLPVFAGDILEIGSCKDFVVDVTANCFEDFKWPSKLTIVETRMTGDNLRDYLIDLDNADERVSLTHVANKAISRAIADGDVIPTKEVYRLLDEVKMRYDSGAGRNESYYCAIESVMDDYFEGLK